MGYFLRVFCRTAHNLVLFAKQSHPPTGRKAAFFCISSAESLDVRKSQTREACKVMKTQQGEEARTFVMDWSWGVFSTLYCQLLLPDQSRCMDGSCIGLLTG